MLDRTGPAAAGAPALPAMVPSLVRLQAVAATGQQ